MTAAHSRLVQHPHHQAGVDTAGGDVLRLPVAGFADGDSLHHRSDAVKHRRDNRRDEAD